MESESSMNQAIHLCRFCRKAVFRGVPGLLILYIIGIMLLCGCLESDYGGKNINESKPGNKDQGTDIFFDLALSEDGRHLVGVLQESESEEWSIWGLDLSSHESVQLDVPDTATRVVFSDNDIAFVLSEREVTEVSLINGEALRRFPIREPYSFITLNERRDKLAVFTTWSTWEAVPKLSVIDLENDEIFAHTFDYPVFDAKWVSSTGDLAVVLDIDNEHSEVVFMIEGHYGLMSAPLPHCASYLEMSPDAEIGMVAPTRCPIDPVSVIDLVNRDYLHTLPGFGPVAFAPNGQYAVAFGRKDDLKETGGIETDTDYSLLFIELPSLELSVFELGDDLPIYAITPDSDTLLLYSESLGQDYYGIYLFDVPSRSLSTTTNDNLTLREFVITPDSQMVYLIDGKLHYLDIQTGEVEAITLNHGDFEDLDADDVPERLNITPDGQTLVLGFLTDSRYLLYDLEAQQITDLLWLGETADEEEE